MFERWQPLRRVVHRELEWLIARGYQIADGSDEGVGGDGQYVLTSPATRISVAVVRERGYAQILFSFTATRLAWNEDWAAVVFAPIATASGPALEGNPPETVRQQAAKLLACIDALESCDPILAKERMDIERGRMRKEMRRR